ncbi:MAG: hypothetical protein IPP78_12295 [Holophagaceae bacterium]|nr:hypothetical protein [Holophagaceae bacterium]
MNALALFLLLTLSLIAISTSLVSGFFRSSHRTQATAPDLAPQEQGEPELRLGQFSRVGSSSVIRAELRESGGGSFSLKSSGSIIRNVLFIDANDGKSWWLLPDSNSAIEEDHELSLTQNGAEIPFGRVYLVGSGEKETSKQSSIILADAKGNNQVVIAKGSILIDELTTFSVAEAKLLYHDSTEYRLASINPSETKLIKDTKMPIVFPPRK